MDHREVRVKILANLYDWFYSGHTGKLRRIDTIVQEAGLTEVDRNLVNGEVEYLRSGGFVNYSSRRTPDGITAGINISWKGIDYIDNVLDAVIKQNSKELSDVGSKMNVSKLKQTLELVQNSSNLLNSLLNIVTKVGQSFG